VASAALKEGRWAKKEATGRQLFRKTLGLIGLGKIGQEVAKRARAFEMTVLAHDPYVPADSARELGTEPVDLDELIERADVISLHAALTEQTRHMIGADELARVKPGALLINCARGQLVDECALVEALMSGRLGGAALDVFEHEPEPRSELVSLPSVVATPHVAASTEEAQALVAREAAEQVLEVLAGGRPRWPVNVPALTREELDDLGPYLPLAERLGRLHAALLSAPPRGAAVYVRGGGAEEHLDIVGGHFLAGLLGALSDEPVNYVNAPVIAAERGLQMSQGIAADTRGYSRYVRASVADGESPVEVAGAVLDRGQARIVEIAGFGLDLVPSDTVLLILNAEPDKPGFIGTVGRILGDAGISILGIQVGREFIGGMGLMAVSVEGEVAAGVREEIAGQAGVTRLEIVRFEE